jgi:hypothetical protein
LDERLKEQCPYLRRGANGEYVIPESKIGEFVRKFQELADSKDHLEHLRLYRAEGKRPPTTDIDD